MVYDIDEELAQQIVKTVKDVCDQDINFIKPSGIILASTNKSRIGSYHEIGHKAYQTCTAIEVESDNSFTGTYKGINLPVSYRHNIVAVIGISGDPDKVRKYAHLAEKITKLLIREKELNNINRTTLEIKTFLVNALCGKQEAERKKLDEYLNKFQINKRNEKRVILISINRSDEYISSSVLEQKIITAFNMASVSLYTFEYPDTYIGITDSKTFEQQEYIFKNLTTKNRSSLKVSIGKSTNIYNLKQSYSTASIALDSLKNKDDNYILYDDMTLEIILSNVSQKNKHEFLSKVLSNISDEERNLLQIYYEEEMSLTKTCDKMFLHKNTIQYKLNHIYEKCGFNPRSFTDAVILYIALKMA